MMLERPERLPDWNARRSATTPPNGNAIISDVLVPIHAMLEDGPLEALGPTMCIARATDCVHL